MAKIIQENTDAEIFQISHVSAYTDDYDTLLEQAQQKQRENTRPALSAEVKNWDNYEVVFDGYLDWRDDGTNDYLHILRVLRLFWKNSNSFLYQ